MIGDDSAWSALVTKHHVLDMCSYANVQHQASCVGSQNLLNLVLVLSPSQAVSSHGDDTSGLTDVSGINMLESINRQGSRHILILCQSTRAGMSCLRVSSVAVTQV